MDKNTKIYIISFGVIAVMIIGTLLFVNGDFGGSDDAGGETAGDYDYKPWTDNWMANFGFELPGETESLLFALQAAIGAIIIGFFIGQNHSRRKTGENASGE